MKPLPSDDSAAQRPHPALRLLKFQTVPRKQQWRQSRPTTSDEEWIRAWETMGRLKEVASRGTVRELVRIMEAVIQQLAAEDPT